MPLHGRFISITCRKVICQALLFTFTDFDGDDMISTDDLRQVINRLTGEPGLDDNEMQQVLDNISI